MKFIVLTSILSGLFIGCYSPPKQEIEKKVEIEKEIKTKRKTNKPLVWITPSKEDCTLNNGTIKNNECNAKWSDANNLCTMIQARLPSIEELRKVVTDCGGKMDYNDNEEHTENEENIVYQDCYKRKGFTSAIHWSSSNSSQYYSDNKLYISFFFGMKYFVDIKYNTEFRCVKVD